MVSGICRWFSLTYEEWRKYEEDDEENGEILKGKEIAVKCRKIEDASGKKKRSKVGVKRKQNRKSHRI